VGGLGWVLDGLGPGLGLGGCSACLLEVAAEVRVPSFYIRVFVLSRGIVRSMVIPVLAGA
jgi:hypothetical protein